MSYTKRIVCLANSFKTGGFCIAGREMIATGFGPWIRPVSDHDTGQLNESECSFADGQLPRLLDIIDVPMLRPVPHNHQTENHLVDSSGRWTRAGSLSFAKIRNLAETPWTLWTNSGSTSTGYSNCVSIAEASKHSSSLCLIWVTQLGVEVAVNSRGKRCYMGIFTLGHRQYRLNITDPIVCRRLHPLQLGEHDFLTGIEILLAISFTEPYVDRRCHKLIAAVITDPAF